MENFGASAPAMGAFIGFALGCLLLVVTVTNDFSWTLEELTECRDAPEWCAKEHPKRFEAVQALTATREADDGKE